MKATLEMLFRLGLCLFLFTTSLSPVYADTAVAVRSALASGQPALIEFGAETCSQCKRMKVVLDGISQRYKGRAHVVQVNVNRDREVTRQFKIMMIPTLVFFDVKGKEVGRTYGFMDEVKVAKRLHDLGAR
jgi:thioredoxin 1